MTSSPSSSAPLTICVNLGRAEEALDFSTEAFQLVRDLHTGPWLFGHVVTAHATALLAVGRVAESRGLLHRGRPYRQRPVSRFDNVG